MSLKLYSKIVLLCLVTLAVWGIAIPFLISYPSTEVVMCGLLLGVMYAGGIVLIFLNKERIKSYMKFLK